MPPEPKTTEEKLRELDRNIARQETAIAPLTPSISPARPERSVIGPMERLGRKILAVAITIWFALMAALIILQQGIEDPMGLAGILAFGAFVCFLIYHMALFQWALVKEVAGWFGRGRKTDQVQQRDD